jgi:hypothetical protein
MEHDGLGVRVRHYCLPAGTPATESRTLGPRHLRRTKYKVGSIPAAYKALPQLPKATGSNCPSLNLDLGLRWSSSNDQKLCLQ